MKRSSHWLGRTILLMVCAAVLSIPACAESEETIRVGVYNKDSYHVIDDQNRNSGYDYEYLREIAEYTGWKYAFVEGSWQECVAMLESGEIDLLGGVEMQADRLETMCFASQPSAYSASCLLIDCDSDRYAYEDYAAFDGIRIGIMSESTYAGKLEKYSQEHQFSYSLKEYETEKQLNEALRQGEIDCIGLSDFRNLGPYKIIARFGDTTRYYATSKKRCDLREKLDNALKEIHERDSFYEYHLHDKYFTTAACIAYSPAELEYIKSTESIQVALFRDIPRVCEYDAASQRYQGIIVEVLELLSKETGLRFEYIEMPEDEMPWEFVDRHPNVLLAPMFQNDLIQYNEKMRFLNTIISGKMVGVTRNDKQDTVLNAGSQFDLAIPKGMYGASEEIQKLFPTSRIITCESHEDGLKMVWRGEADMTLINEMLATYLLQSPFYHGMNMFHPTPIVENTTLGLSSFSDAALVSILNKAVQTVNGMQIQQLVMKYAMEHPYQMSVPEFLYEYWQATALFVILVIGGSVALILDRKRKKELRERAVQLKVAEERLKTEEKYKQELFRQANFDQLTGLYNHRYFLEKATELLRKDPDVVYTFIHVNLSNFKLINEVYGTEQGDAVLVETARCLKKNMRAEGLLGRLYADQFVVCYPLEQRYLDQMQDWQTLFYFNCGDKNISVQMKVGVFVNDQHIRNAVQAIAYARIALQNHDAPSSNHVYLYQEAYLNKLLLNQFITNEMEHALKDGQFRVYLQPQYDIKSKRLVSAEALVRWAHPTRGVIPPNAFIPVFEMNGFICDLDVFVFETVCKVLADWKRQGKLLPISVNLSRVDLQNPELLPKMRAIMSRYSIPHEYIHLEITEAAYVEDSGAFCRVIDELRQEGFLIEMDDFGSGYSALNTLKDIPVDVLKLDMKFFSEEANMDKGGSIIESVVKLAHNLGILVVAEGVENEREANFLLSIHCLIAQGYLYGRPMPLEEFEKLLTTVGIGEKMRTIVPDDGECLYWEIEQFNVLLRNSGIILFDYDPARDHAHVVAGGEEESLKTVDIPRYTEPVIKKFKAHPDYEQAVKDALNCPEPNPAEVEFMADSSGTGTYEWFHAVVYHYFADGQMNRVIGLIERKEK